MRDFYNLPVDRQIAQAKSVDRWKEEYRSHREDNDPDATRRAKSRPVSEDQDASAYA